MENKFYLYESFFTEKEKEVMTSGKLSATLFTYSTGVKAVKLKNDKGMPQRLRQPQR